MQSSECHKCAQSEKNHYPSPPITATWGTQCASFLLTQPLSLQHHTPHIKKTHSQCSKTTFSITQLEAQKNGEEGGSREPDQRHAYTDSFIQGNTQKINRAI